MKSKKIIIYLFTAVIIIVAYIYIITNKSSDMDRGLYLNGEKILVENHIITEEDDYFLNLQILTELDVIDAFNDKQSGYIQIYYNYNLYEINYNEKSNTFTKRDDKIYINTNYIQGKTDYNIELYDNGNYIFIDSIKTKGSTV